MIVDEIFSICRICLEEGCGKKLIHPCRCKGSMGGVHINCLENWLNVRNIEKCEVCNAEYSIQRILKYGRIRSIFPFVRTHRGRVLHHVFCIIIISAAVILTNNVIISIQRIMLQANQSSFSQLNQSIPRLLQFPSNSRIRDPSKFR